MNKNQNEMTSEQLDDGPLKWFMDNIKGADERGDDLNLSDDFVRTLTPLLVKTITLARQGLQLREKLSQFELAADIVKREGETLRADLIQCNRENRALTAVGKISYHELFWSAATNYDLWGGRYYATEQEATESVARQVKSQPDIGFQIRRCEVIYETPTIEKKEKSV